MTTDDSRRGFIKSGALAALGTIAATRAAAGENAERVSVELNEPAPQSSSSASTENARTAARFTHYSRYVPSYGGPTTNDAYLGKLVPGLRDPSLPPVPFEAPDLDKVPWRMVEGRKEFRLACEPVRRELLPGFQMDFFGYNGSMPGPTIEAFQGDRVRIIVDNKLPEPTSLHWHGFELPVEMDGVPFMTQNLIMPGESFTYEFDLHQAGTFFYHSHIAMQEAFGMAGFFIVHPAATWQPVVDRDLGLIFQNFLIPPNTTVPDSMAMDWNWHTINGRSGPFSTPMVVKHGERVRIRILDFSPQQHHPIHLHGHTYWVTGHGGARIPVTGWQPRNTELIGVAQASDLEFIAFNPGDWLMHCHMVHHMMNHMTQQVGPRIRNDMAMTDFKSNLNTRPGVSFQHDNPAFGTVGYPQMMHMHPLSPQAIQRITAPRETRGMREHWYKVLKGLMTVVRVLPDDLYELVMHGQEPLAPGSVFDEIVRRRKQGLIASRNRSS